MKNNSFAHGQELPLGLSMALAQVPAAYAYFAKLDPLQRQQISPRHTVFAPKRKCVISSTACQTVRSLIQVFSEQKVNVDKFHNKSKIN